MSMIKKHIFLLLLITCTSCNDKVHDPYIWNELTVTATAFNNTIAQTDATPHTTAWGDTLTNNMNCIAVSRDLIKLGLKHNTPVKIKGFDSVFYVKDKMHYKWKNRIDIFMGKDIKKARQWGRQKVKIEYGILKDSINIK